MLFIVVGVVGLALLVVALLFGEILDGVFDAIGVDSFGGLFSTEVIGGALAAFGFGGWVLQQGVGVSTGAAVGGGIAAGVVMGGIAFRLSRALIRMRTDATPAAADLVGALGKVITPIPAGGLGEVTVTRHGQPFKLSARAEEPLPAGTRIVVVAVRSPTSVLVASSDL